MMPTRGAWVRPGRALSHGRRFHAFGAEIVPDAKLKPESPCSWMKQEPERWGLVIKSAGVYAD